VGQLIRDNYRRFLLIALLILPSLVWAADDILLDLDTGRKGGLFTKTPIKQRAILIPPEQQSQTALLFFRGWPGIARIESVNDKSKNLIMFLSMNEQRFKDEGVALVIVDCPTSEWGQSGPNPTACDDGYRSSGKHLSDVRLVMKELREKYGYKRQFIMGHSYGTISSKWLALGLGDEIAGSIHSAAMTIAGGGNYTQFGYSMRGFPVEKIKAPVLHIHNENDACRLTPYQTVRDYSKNNLVTVRGGVPEGDPCGGRHFHSYAGREAAVVDAILAWINKSEVMTVVGE